MLKKLIVWMNCRVRKKEWNLIVVHFTQKLEAWIDSSINISFFTVSWKFNHLSFFIFQIDFNDVKNNSFESIIQSGNEVEISVTFYQWREFNIKKKFKLKIYDVQRNFYSWDIGYRNWIVINYEKLLNWKCLFIYFF